MSSEFKVVLLSIHPKYVDQILDGRKRVEFRRVWSKQNVKHIVIYSTSPVMRVVAVAEIDKVVQASKNGLWNLAKLYGGGISKTSLYEYFSGRSLGYGIVLKKVAALDKAIKLDEVKLGLKAPQSYLFLEEDDLKNVYRNLRKKN